MNQISGVDLYFLTKEFQDLIGGKIDKIYQIDKKEFLFNFHVTGKGKKSLRINVPNFIFLTEKKLKTPEQPPGYCMFLRKRLKMARINEISQIGLERILKIVFDTKDEKYILFIELFSKGNMILTDENLKIIQPLERQTWKDREVLAKRDYMLPSGKENPLNLDIEKLKMLLNETKRDKLVTFFAIELGFGGKYAEEVCDLAGIDKNSNPKEIKKYENIIKAINKLFDKTVSISSKMDVDIPAELAKEEIKSSKKEDKLKEIIRNQNLHIKNLEKDIEKYNKVGELVYSNYQYIEKILTQFNEARKEMPIKEIIKKVTNKKISEIDQKEKTITFELN